MSTKPSPVQKSLSELKDLSGESVQQMTIRLSSALYERVVAQAVLNGNHISREVVGSLAEHFVNLDHGVSLALDPEIRRRLDLCAEAMGADRATLVKLLIHDHLPTLLQATLDKKALADELTRSLDAPATKTKR